MHLRRATPLMRVMFVCARASAGREGETTGRQEEGEKSVWRLKKSQHTTLHWHVSPLLLLRHSELCLRGTWVDLGES